MCWFEIVEKLRVKYETLRLYEERMKEQPRVRRWDERCKELKKEIRKYNHEVSDRRYIGGTDDRYLVLIELPDVDDADAYFRENELKTYKPSQYDCTGQAFTISYKIVERNGRKYAYHRVGLDV